MNIASVASAVSNSQQDSYGVLVMRKALQTMAQQGQDMTAMLNQSAPSSPPNLGKNVDIKA